MNKGSSSALAISKTPFTLLYEDEWFVAMEKPEGLLVHRTSIASDRKTCMNLLRNQLGRWVYPAHRLDRKTSGVLFFALDRDSAREAGKIFMEREVRKLYTAVVRGWVEEEGTIDTPLKNHETGEMLEAVTRYRPLGKVELPYPVGPYQTARYSLLSVEPRTGRWHQIRRHMKHFSHPVVGDSLHGEIRQNRLFREKFGFDRLFLHATRLKFTHPFTKEPIDIVSPIPPTFTQACDRFGWKADVEFAKE